MKKLHLKSLSILFAGFFILAGYTAVAQGTKGNKNVVKEERTVGAFTGLNVGGAFNVFLTQEDKNSLIIEADENLMEKITTEVHGNVLEIGSRNIRNATKLNIYISTPAIGFFEISGAATVKSENNLQSESISIHASGASRADLQLSAPSVEIEASGASHVVLTGSADTQKIEASGASEVNVSGLQAKEITAEASGAANVVVGSSERIDRETSGAGSIKVKGETKSSGSSSTVSASSGASSSDDPSVVVVNSRNSHSYKSGDTTTVKVGSVVVEVIDGDSTKVSVGNHSLVVDDNGNVKWKRNRNHKFNGHWAGFDLGINGFVNKDYKINLPDEYNFLDLKYEKSFDVNVNFFEQNINLARNKLGLVTGLGLRWNNYRFDDNVVLVPDSKPLGGYKDNSRNYVKSKLVVNYLNVPLLLEYQTNRFSRSNSFHIAGGMVMGWRYASHTKRVYHNDGKQKPKTGDSFQLNPFRYDASVRIGWGIINLYATYSLNQMFKDGGGPELYPFAVGLTLAGW